MRTCVVCEVEKDVMEFYDIGDENPHFQPVCKRCRYDNLGPEVKTIEEQDDYFKTFTKFIGE